MSTTITKTPKQLHWDLALECALARTRAIENGDRKRVNEIDALLEKSTRALFPDGGRGVKIDALVRDIVGGEPLVFNTEPSPWLEKLLEGVPDLNLVLRSLECLERGSGFKILEDLVSTLLRGRTLSEKQDAVLQRALAAPPTGPNLTIEVFGFCGPFTETNFERKAGPPRVQGGLEGCRNRRAAGGCGDLGCAR